MSARNQQSGSAIVDRAQQQAPQAGRRAVFTYDLPVSIGQEAGIASLGFHQLTVDEELMATKRARGDAMRLALELVKQCLAEYTPVGSDAAAPVSLADGSSDLLWNRLPPKARTLVMAAYGELHQPSDSEADVFLKSRRSRA